MKLMYLGCIKMDECFLYFEPPFISTRVESTIETPLCKTQHSSTAPQTTSSKNDHTVETFPLFYSVNNIITFIKRGFVAGLLDYLAFFVLVLILNWISQIELICCNLFYNIIMNVCARVGYQVFPSQKAKVEVKS